MTTGVRTLLTSDVFTRKIHVSQAVANLSEETDQPESRVLRKP